MNCHATSTPRGDTAEIGAISTLIEKTGSVPYITANKSCIGHLLGRFFSLSWRPEILFLDLVWAIQFKICLGGGGGVIL